jgi:hypothetical protein
MPTFGIIQNSEVFTTEPWVHIHNTASVDTVFFKRRLSEVTYPLIDGYQYEMLKVLLSLSLDPEEAFRQVQYKPPRL